MLKKTLIITAYSFTYSVMNKVTIMQVRDAKDEQKNSVDTYFENRFDVRTYNKMLNQVMDKTLDYGAHAVPVIDVEDNNKKIWRMLLPSTTFQGTDRAQVGRSLRTNDFINGIWQSILSRQGQLAIERPLNCLFENQPISQKNIRGIRQKIKDSLINEKKFFHFAMLYQIPNKIKKEILIKDIEHVQNQVAQIALLDEWFNSKLHNYEDVKKIIADIKSASASGAAFYTNDFILFADKLRAVFDPENTPIDLGMDSYKKSIHELVNNLQKINLLEEKDILEANGLPDFENLIAVQQFHTKVLKILYSKLHNEYRANFTKFGLHENVGEEKQLKDTPEALKKLIQKGTGIIKPIPISCYHVLFNHMDALTKANAHIKNYKAHEDPTAVLPVLVSRDKGRTLELCHIKLHSPGLGDLYKMWKEDEQVKHYFEAKFAHEVEYEERLSLMLMEQAEHDEIISSVLLDHPPVPTGNLNVIFDAIESFTGPKAAIVADVKNDISDEQKIAYKKVQKALADAKADNPGVTLTPNERLRVYLEAEMINIEVGQAFEDMVSMETRLEKWQLTSTGKSLLNSTVTTLLAGQQTFLHPENRSIVPKANLVENKIILELLTALFNCAEGVLRNGMGVIPDDLYEKTIRDVLRRNCEHDLKHFFEEANKPAQGWSINIYKKIKGHNGERFKVGNTYSLGAVARATFPGDDNPVAKFIATNEGNYYHDLMLEPFVQAHPQLNLNPAAVADAAALARNRCGLHAAGPVGGAAAVASSSASAARPQLS